MSMRKSIRILLPVAIIAAGLAVAGLLYATKPTAGRTPPVKPVPLVEVMTAEVGRHKVTVEAMGTVAPSRSITLKSQVAGRVLEISPPFQPGGAFKTGELLLKLDPEDFQLSVEKEKSAVSRALADWQLEKGHQEVAQNEAKLMQTISGKPIKDKSLVLRQPQMAQAQADLDSAHAALKEAELNLERTGIYAPFDCLVIERLVDVGSQIGVQDNLATLVGTDSFWIEASAPEDRLRWIEFPNAAGREGSLATVRSQGGVEWRGRVIRLLGDLNRETRMARLLIEVADPLSNDAGDGEIPLLLGSYVSVIIEGRDVDNVVEVPRSAIRDGSNVWLLDEGLLKIAPVQTVWGGKDFVYLAEGVKPGASIIVSELSAPVDGMELRLESEKPGPEPGGPKPTGSGDGYSR